MKRTRFIIIILVYVCICFSQTPPALFHHVAFYDESTCRGNPFAAAALADRYCLGSFPGTASQFISCTNNTFQIDAYDSSLLVSNSSSPFGLDSTCVDFNQTFTFPIGECLLYPFNDDQLIHFIVLECNLLAEDLPSFDQTHPLLPDTGRSQIITTIHGALDSDPQFCETLFATVFYQRNGGCGPTFVDSGVVTGRYTCNDDNTGSLLEVFEDVSCLNTSQRSTLPETCLHGLVNSMISTRTLCGFDATNQSSDSTEIILAIVLPISVVLICTIFVACITVYYIRATKKSYDDHSIHLPTLDEKTPILQNVKIGDPLGKGHFGIVYKGIWQGNQVALKNLGSQEFENELSLSIGLRHPNVLTVYGLYILDNIKYFLVTEYMDRGDLLNLLHRDAEINSHQLHEMCRQTGLGMQYLHENNILHRDLAARNLLVSGPSDTYLLKIADFGLSRQTEDYYESEGSSIPVRWTAPEAIEFRKFSKHSDVWSFGVVIWEIWTRGAIPYAGEPNKKILKLLQKGKKLELPSTVPRHFHNILESCLQLEPRKRPLFTDIVDQLDNKSDSFLKSATNLPSSRSSKTPSTSTYQFSPSDTTGKTPDSLKEEKRKVAQLRREKEELTRNNVLLLGMVKQLRETVKDSDPDIDSKLSLEFPDFPNLVSFKKSISQRSLSQNHIINYLDNGIPPSEETLSEGVEHGYCYDPKQEFAEGGLSGFEPDPKQTNHAYSNSHPKHAYGNGSDHKNHAYANRSDDTSSESYSD